MSYSIIRWDVLSSDNINKAPAIYVKPDLAFMEFVRANNFSIMCQIDGTDGPYDGKLCVGIVNKSSQVPNCRPNFFAQQGDFIITLNLEWMGYPSPNKLGNVTIYGHTMPSQPESNYRAKDARFPASSPIASPIASPISRPLPTDKPRPAPIKKARPGPKGSPASAGTISPEFEAILNKKK
jgi:hypothetical protein